MKYIEANLTANETILAYGRVHWFVFVFGTVAALLGAVLLLLTTHHVTTGPPNAPNVGFIMFFGGVLGAWMLILAAFMLLRAWMRVRFTELAVTSQRVVAKFGWIRRRTVELNHNMVEGITVYQGFMGRIFDFGTLIIRGAGGGQTPVPTIAQPLEFRRVVTEQLAAASRGEPELTAASPPPEVVSSPSPARDPGAELESVSRVDFEPRTLLSQSEFRILRILEQAVRQADKDHRVLPRTGLSHAVTPRNSSATAADRDLASRSISGERLDFLVIDRDGRPVLAVEYRGREPYGRKAFIRDALKREALRKAGIELLEVPSGYEASDLEARFRSVLSRRPARSTRNR